MTDYKFNAVSKRADDDFNTVSKMTDDDEDAWLKYVVWEDIEERL
jgi:hypothetical protein